MLYRVDYHGTLRVYPGTARAIELLVVEAVDVRAQVARRQALVLVSIVVLDVVRIIAVHGRDAAGEPLVGAP